MCNLSWNYGYAVVGKINEANKGLELHLSDWHSFKFVVSKFEALTHAFYKNWIQLSNLIVAEYSLKAVFVLLNVLEIRYKIGDLLYGVVLEIENWEVLELLELPIDRCYFVEGEVYFLQSLQVCQAWVYFLDFILLEVGLDHPIQLKKILGNFLQLIVFEVKDGV